MVHWDVGQWLCRRQYNCISSGLFESSELVATGILLGTVNKMG